VIGQVTEIHPKNKGEGAAYGAKCGENRPTNAAGSQV